ncbi:MAG: hypothetical protein J6U20_10645 [Fibrobacter sp.]|nr:hypothetical protein [Fibrobacter sp.]
MFSKKVLFPMAVVAMASFVACGDDSSSGVSSDVAPASVKNFVDTKDVTCSATANMCAKIYVEEDLKDTVQCNGTSWEMMLLGKPVTGCENAAPAADPAATPAADPAATPAETPAADPAATPAETPAADPAATPAETPAADPAATPAETPAADPAATPAETPAETPAAAATGDKAACMKGKICTEGSADLAAECKAEDGETLMEACPAGGEVCDIGEPGITMYFYEGAEMSCEDYKAMIAAFSAMGE